MKSFVRQICFLIIYLFLPTDGTWNPVPRPTPFLWQAYVLMSNKTYTEKICFFILDWIEKNPITQQGTDATRTIDTGIRCMNWSTLLLHLLADDIISEADAKLIINSLKEQYTLITDSNYIVNKVPVFQLRKEAPVSEDVAVAWDVEKSDGTKQTLILWGACQVNRLKT